mmetsp:Transcript_8158/g.13172  ORF Transcript_8158/g.13172 Transcript_8158/m.13172 type:complete len:152 (+) Transcript_8158:434-889(+)
MTPPPPPPPHTHTHTRTNYQHVPGSVFTVVVEEDLSIGGEGKVFCFFSTTSGNLKQRSDINNTKTLLTSKNIHLRKDFVPWIPVDIMDRKDREAVFAKAGTRKLPIVIIDDEYLGDYDKLLKVLLLIVCLSTASLHGDEMLSSSNTVLSST